MYKINLWQCETSCFICRLIIWHFHDISAWFVCTGKTFKIQKKIKIEISSRLLIFLMEKNMFVSRKLLKGTLYLSHLV